MNHESVTRQDFVSDNGISDDFIYEIVLSTKIIIAAHILLHSDIHIFTGLTTKFKLLFRNL